MAKALVEHHGGEVPHTMEELVELPGVGRKTANVVLGHALGVPGLPVDRHVLRVSNRIGIAEGDDPILVEKQLCAAMPPERWTRTSDTLILHGRRICRPKPLCDVCAVRDDCDYFANVVSQERSPKPAARRSKNARPKSKPKKKSTPKKKPKSRAAKRVRKARR
jgi:endonuclease III